MDALLLDLEATTVGTSDGSQQTGPDGSTFLARRDAAVHSCTSSGIGTGTGIIFEYDSSHPAKKKTRQSSSPKSELLTKALVSTEDSSAVLTSYLDQAERSSATPIATTTAEDENLRRVVMSAARMLTNAPPPTTFTVSKRDNEARLERRFQRRVAPLNDDRVGRSKEEGILHVVESEEGENVSDRAGPLLFDGSVANATPAGEGADGAPALAAVAAGLQEQHQQHEEAGGGFGTALHLACALDSPLSLAIFLVMGGNVLSRHTAFRRLMVHEAASSDSPDCLRLLLELADTYRESLAEMHEHGTSVINSIWNSYSEIRAQEQKEHQHGFSSLAQHYNREEHQILQPINQREEAEEISVLDTCTCSLSYVGTLKLMSDLGKQVVNGSMTDLDAGRLLMSRVEVPAATRAAIVSISGAGSSDHGSTLFHYSTRTRLNPSFDFLNFPSLVSASTASAENRPRGDADGHGNTALHWASFKNAAECVSVLLSHNADPNARAEPSGWTPLHDAAYSDAADCVQMLVNAGADVDSKANSGATPLCFAAQEDSPAAARLLLEAGARSDVRCGQGGNGTYATNSAQQHQPHPSRFSGYTPLHYCAHYNAYRAARIILNHEHHVSKGRPSSLLEMLDFNDKLPIHVAVTRSSSDVLRELLRGGARIDTRVDTLVASPPVLAAGPLSSPSSPPRMLSETAASPHLHYAPATPLTSHRPATVTPVSSPVLRSMIPPRPISSSKPWNCVTQESINQCRALIREAELNWCPERHSLFHPTDRRAVMELLRIGKRLEQMGTGICVYDIWPDVLSFCGRGWFEVGDQEEGDNRVNDHKRCVLKEADSHYDAKPPARTSAEGLRDGEQDDGEFTQFQLE